MTGAIKEIPEPMPVNGIGDVLSQIFAALDHLTTDAHDAAEQRAKMQSDIAETKMRAEASVQAIAELGPRYTQLAQNLQQIMQVVEEARPLLESPMAGWLRSRGRKPPAAPGG